MWGSQAQGKASFLILSTCIKNSKVYLLQFPVLWLSTWTMWKQSDKKKKVWLNSCVGICHSPQIHWALGSWLLWVPSPRLPAAPSSSWVPSPGSTGRRSEWEQEVRVLSHPALLPGLTSSSACLLQSSAINRAQVILFFLLTLNSSHFC